MPLTKVRKEIDKLDDMLLKLFKKRSKLVERVGLIKKKHKLPIFNKDREIEISHKLEKFAQKHKLRPEFLKRVWKAMIDEAKVIEKKGK
jgi:chorismate mutase